MLCRYQYGSPDASPPSEAYRLTSWLPLPHHSLLMMWLCSRGRLPGTSTTVM